MYKHVIVTVLQDYVYYCIYITIYTHFVRLLYKMATLNVNLKSECT